MTTMRSHSAIRSAAREREPFTGKDFRAALGGFATGVTVVTTYGAEGGHGMTANSFSSVSLDPPLVLVCVAKTASAVNHLERNGIFAVNVLAAGQEPLSRYFASRDRPGGARAFAAVPHHRGVTGAPILEGAAAYLDCVVHASHEAGDHHIFVGEVLALSCDAEAEPLIFHGGRYRMLGAG